MQKSRNNLHIVIFLLYFRWLVLRSQKRDAPPTQSDTGTVKVPLMTGVDWCNDADDWGTDTPDM